MLLTVPTRYRACKVTLHVKRGLNGPQQLGVYAIDRLNPKTFYSKLICDLPNPEHKLPFQFPQSPGILNLFLFDPANPQIEPEVEVKVQRSPLKNQKHLLGWKVRRRIPFLMEFARKSKYIPSNRIITNGKQKIYYYDIITNPDGSQEETPARVDDAIGAIDVGKETTDLCTVFMLTCILFHEDAHFHLNGEFYNEFEADFNGLKTYLYSGHPWHEAMFAFTKIFNDTDLNHQRTGLLDYYIDEYKRTGTLEHVKPNFQNHGVSL